MAEDTTIVLQGEVATFFYRQDDLADVPRFAGLFGESIIDSLTKPKGDLSPIYGKNPARPNEFRILRLARGAPDLGEISINEYIKRNARSMLEQMERLDCPYVIVIKIDNCNRPDDLDVINDSLWIVDGTRLNNLEFGALQQRDSNEAVEATGTMNHAGWDRYFIVQAGEQAAVLVLAEVIDVAYADEFSCGSCAPFDSGCDVLFALTAANSGSPGLSSQIIVTRDAGATYTKYDIAPLGGLSGSAMAGVGSKMVVISEAFGGHVVAPKSDVSASAWIAVTSGYVVGGSPRAIVSLAPQRTFIGGAGGYIYQSEDIEAGVEVVHDGSLTSENVNGIHGLGEVLVSAHDNNIVLRSVNGGKSWSLITGPSMGDNLLCVWVLNQNQFWIGTNAGELWYTTDAGVNWTQRQLPDQASITAITDIKFSPDFPQHGAIAVQKSLQSEIYRTLFGGRRWYRQSPWIIQMGTAPERYNKLALCSNDQIAAGGLKADSTDGILVVAQ